MHYGTNQQALRTPARPLCRAAEGVVGIAADASLPALLAHASIAAVARETPDAAAVGFAACVPHCALASLLPDNPHAPELAEWLSTPEQSAAADLTVAVLLLDPALEQTALTALLSHITELHAPLTALRLVSEAAVPLSQPHVAAAFRPAAGAGPGGAAAAVARGDTLRPCLVVRRAEVEDSDDVAPLLAAAQQEYGVLAQVCSRRNPQKTGQCFCLYIIPTHVYPRWLHAADPGVAHHARDQTARANAG